MLQGIGAPHGFISFDRRSQAVSVVSALALSVLAGASMLHLRPVAAPGVAKAPADASTLTVPSNPYGALLIDLRSRSPQVSLAQSIPAESNPESIPPALSAALQEPQNVAPTPAAPQLGERAPLPPPRPSEFGSPASHGSFQAPVRYLTQQNRKTALPDSASDNRTIFEKIFGAPQPSEPVLAYAAPESGFLRDGRNNTSEPSLRFDRWTAVYDISAHTVYLPNGTKLEAHSGLGDKLDDPRYVHVRMRGATPPHVYELSLRERRFHGVQALRLKPVGDGDIFGRAGLLAHTYMLGPRGDSNGCVSFRNYDAFLRAFQNGEVKRLVVVARQG